MPKTGECAQLKIFKRKIKSPVMTDADFKSILIPENTGKQNPAVLYEPISKTCCFHSWLYISKS